MSAGDRRLPMHCDAGGDCRSLRVDRFGLRKLRHHKRTVRHLDERLNRSSE